MKGMSFSPKVMNMVIEIYIHHSPKQSGSTFLNDKERIILEFYFSAKKIITAIKSERGSVLAINISPFARVSVIA